VSKRKYIREEKKMRKWKKMRHSEKERERKGAIRNTEGDTRERETHKREK